MISKLLFESPWLLLILLVAVQFGLIATWSRRRTHRWTRAVWSSFAAMPALLLLSALVVTPRERVIGLCRGLAAMVEAGDVATIGQHLAGDFEAAGFSRLGFLDRIEQSLARYDVNEARLRSFQVTFPRRNEAVAVFNATCRVRSVDAFFDRLASRWRLTLRDDGRLWRVTRVEALPTALSPIRDVRDCFR